MVQGGWTRQLRKFLIEQTGMDSSSLVLEVGSGTGVILRDTIEIIGNLTVGIDINLDYLSENKKIHQDQVVAGADVYSLPFPVNTFDFVISHYFFLWLKDPVRSFVEIKRVLKPGGFAIAFAEPDYAARIEHPEQFLLLGNAQTESLIAQGINSITGRSLPTYFAQSGFSDIQYGFAGFQVPAQMVHEDWESEWIVLEHDLAQNFSTDQIDQYKSEDKYSRLSGSRVSWVPTFYAFGKKN